MKISRRKFLKILAAIPVIAAAPMAAAKEKLIPAYYNGMEFKFKPKYENGGATININDLGKKPIVNEKLETITVSGASNPTYNGDFTITVKDNFSHPMLETWANINDIQRMPNEKDNDLRKHIMGKISKRG